MSAYRTPVLIVAAVFAILVLSVVQQSSGPVVSNTRIGLDTSVEGVLRTAVSEVREMRAQLSQLEERVYSLQRSSRAPALDAPPGRQPLAAREDAVVLRTSSSSAPSSFLDAVAIDDGRPANFSALANVTGSQPECGMLVFRHIEKTGGTTFRMHMVALHDCGWHVWGYKGTIRLCNKAKAEWEMLKEPSKRPAGRADGPLLPHLTVESHAEHGDYKRMMDAWVPMVQAWHGTCGIWLISILRDPLKRQVSHYSYHKTTRGFDIPHIHNFTQYFTEQYSLLNRRSANTQFLQRHILLPKLLDMERRGEREQDLRAYALGELDKFDVIGVFENYTASMLLVSRVTGLPLSKYSAPSTVKNRDIKPHRSKVRQIWDEELATEAQRAFFQKHLGLDYWLYAEVRRRFDALVKAGGAQFESELRELLHADASQLDASLERVCESSCDSGLDKEQSTNRFVWKNQQCWPLAERELESCGKNPHLRPDFNYALCGR
ncbi:hypothetical protein KFE25_007505 [Diacronema lutheri]|uniref:Sulfotransferase domain-containing protein n=1 Tax=Diacronema lutheri TaxID=2081491 RepID=A0A8J5XUX0_DIALT|nr:hypothetical protein KFE25_007505 [Diacronema lutheri]